MMARGIYTLAFGLLMPAVMLRLLWRSRKAPDYRRRWRERLGHCPWRLDGGAIWIHAVSVGEVEAAIPLIEALRARHPERPFIVTTTTPTGSARIREAFGGQIHHAYLPYDLPRPLERFLERSRPACLLVLETEIWPNLFALCERRSIPTIIVNARLSARSAARYGHLGRFIRRTLGHCRTIACQAPADADRFRGLGVDEERIAITGNIKFDRPLPEDIASRAAELRRLWQKGDGPSRFVWLAASTHEGEEAICLEAFERCRHHIPDLLLCLVPRHPERFSDVETLCRRAGHAVARRSRIPAGGAADAAILIGDTMGELLAFYATADIAFVGGSLVPTGGHNVLEPAALARPILFGPAMFNFATIARQLLEHEAAIEVGSAEALAETITDLYRDAEERTRMGEAARAVCEENRGALERTVALIEQALSA